MAGVFSFGAMANELKVVLFLYLCIGESSAGVLSRNSKQHENDILNMALEPSDEKVENRSVHGNSTQASNLEIHENDTLSKVESIKSFNTSILVDFNQTEEGSFEFDSIGSSVEPTLQHETENFISVKAAKESEDKSIKLTEDFDELEQDLNLHQLASNASSNSTSDDSIKSLSKHLVALNGDVNDKVFTDNVTDFDLVRETSSLEEISNLTSLLPSLDWLQSNLSDEIGSSLEDLGDNLNGTDFNTLILQLLNDTESKINMDFSGDLIDSIEDNNEILDSNERLETEIPVASEELENTETKNASEGILSAVGLEFLMNSDVAKNAALAMTVFNFTDSSLTDHIIEENDFHNFIDLVIPSLADDHNSSTTPVLEEKEHSDLIHINLNISDALEGFEIGKQSIDIPFEDGDKTSNITETMVDVNETGVDLTELFENSNETLELANLTESTEWRNETLDIGDSLEVNETDLSGATSALELNPNNTITNVDAECPSPGICLFWFLSQDTCTENSHCPGSRICCRIRCSKNCIEI